MARHTSGNIGFLAAVALGLANGAALANPEAGGDASQSNNLVGITSASFAAPTILRSVAIKCPVAGFLIANADASFFLSPTPGATASSLEYSISRTTAFDASADHSIRIATPGLVSSIPGSIQRFDSCQAGQTITYRFVALLGEGLTAASDASQPRLSVIFLRDPD
jgi:hypothetical protein